MLITKRTAEQFFNVAERNRWQLITNSDVNGGPISSPLQTLSVINITVGDREESQSYELTWQNILTPLQMDYWILILLFESHLYGLISLPYRLIAGVGHKVMLEIVVENDVQIIFRRILPRAFR